MFGGGVFIYLKGGDPGIRNGKAEFWLKTFNELPSLHYVHVEQDRVIYRIFGQYMGDFVGRGDFEMAASGSQFFKLTRVYMFYPHLLAPNFWLFKI